MKGFVILFSCLFLLSCSSYKNNSVSNASSSSQKVELYSLKVINSGKDLDVKSIFVGEDYTYLSDLYSSKGTKFYFQNELFTGIGFIENENQITRISFKNGTIDGSWYDRIIWNQNLTNEGNFVNGVKDGIWKTYYDGELGHTEIYENGVLKN